MTKSFKIYTISVLLVLTAILQLPAGGQQGAEAGMNYPIQITVTTGMIGDLVQAVGGDHVAVEVLMGEEVDPHLYRPTRADIARMQNADVIFYNGLYLEGRMGDTLVQMARNKPVYAVTELVDEQYLLEHEEYENAFDPHLWMNARLWIRALDAVEQVLAELDAEHSTDYRANAENYRNTLIELDAYVSDITASTPEENRTLITAHDAFGYFGAAYGFEVIGVQGISTESEAGLDDVNQLVRFISENRIRAVFAESTVPDRALQAIIEGAQSRGHDVILGGELFSDAMGSSGSYEGTYIGMLDHNATTIVRALGGNAPERGWQGKLSTE